MDERYFDMLVEFLGGYMGGDEENHLQSKICRLIVVGDSILNQSRNEELLKLKTYNQSISQQAKAKINQVIFYFIILFYFY